MSSLLIAAICFDFVQDTCLPYLTFACSGCHEVGCWCGKGSQGWSSRQLLVLRARCCLQSLFGLARLLLFYREVADGFASSLMSRGAYGFREVMVWRPWSLRYLVVVILHGSRDTSLLWFVMGLATWSHGTSFWFSFCKLLLPNIFSLIYFPCVFDHVSHECSYDSGSTCLSFVLA